MYEWRPSGVPMRYTTYFYRQSTNSTRLACCFADPTLEFQSLDDARTFAQAAASASQFQTDLFRIATPDRKINEHWIKDGNDWKIPNRYKAQLVRGENHSGIDRRACTDFTSSIKSQHKLDQKSAISSCAASAAKSSLHLPKAF
jgi:hypothetical protein